MIYDFSQETGEGLHYKDTKFPSLHQANYKDILLKKRQKATLSYKSGQYGTNRDIAIGGGCIFALLTTDYAD